MALILQLAGEFPSAVRAGGNEYFRSGKVKIKNGSPMNLEASVEDITTNNVRLWREGNEISLRCSCPDYAAGGPCKHLWAALLAADAENYLQGGSGGAGRLTLIEEDPEEARADYFEDDDEADDDDEDVWGEAYDRDEEEDNDDEWIDPSSRNLRDGTKSNVVRGQFQSQSKKDLQSWRDQLAALPMKPREIPYQSVEWPADRELLYVIDVNQTLQNRSLMLEVHYRDRRKDGDWAKPKSQRFPRAVIPNLPDPVDRDVLTLLAGGKDMSSNNNYYYGYGYSYDSVPNLYQLTGLLPQTVIPMIARTGRARLRLLEMGEIWLPLEWDEGEPYDFWLKVELSEDAKHYLVTGELRRGEERMPLKAPTVLIDDGLLFTRQKAARFDAGGAFNWVVLMRKQKLMIVPVSHRDELLGELLKSPQLPRLDLPEEMRYEEVVASPRPRLTIREPQKSYWGSQKLQGELEFDYEGTTIASQDATRGVYHSEAHRFLLRNTEAEQAAAERLQSLGWRLKKSDQGFQQGLSSYWELAPTKLPRVVRDLLAEGWHVEAEGKVYRRPGNFNIEVSSRIDWFELHGKVDFGDGVTANLPALLAALRRGESLVKLDDGTYGMLPEEWLNKYGLMASLGEVKDDHLRFKKTQLGVLDALLATQPEASFDTAFDNAREMLKSFDGIKSVEPPPDFVGQLRPYQNDGLGWMQFLQQFNFGGCLADCMGLGKTVQVLALLESRRLLRNGATETSITNGKSKSGKDKSPNPLVSQSPSLPVPPSLVVVPRSLVFNWKQEAAKFTPKLRVLDHTGQDRGKVSERMNDCDLVITTYGTLRSDALDFRDAQFDYVILDEAQAIKNADTASAKAARLLQGNYRLAMSGTPIENHLGELWSLFDFLNPGMLGSASIFKLTGTGARNPDEETRKLLSHALRPFILRRTKEQVAKDLPPKLEQTLFCELEPPQRKLYDELRDHYRNSLLGRIERDGIAKAKIQILEALLRLRQAACHPGLVDKSRTGDPSAKLDMLLPQLLEVIDEGHKVLVFSQFTSFLAILREQLDKEEVTYEYLDGRTRDRQSRVEKFQNDPDCKLFLISLKAGGLGLNLTAAEYVFLLDPWWNPAVEAQAIDRAHRIGQTNQVFAYRIIARDTVEEKVLELQNTKRDLADAIISADNSVIRSLGKEDLELLLS
jgi:superfamily II DNA or RNA helicase